MRQALLPVRATLFSHREDQRLLHHRLLNTTCLNPDAPKRLLGPTPYARVLFAHGSTHLDCASWNQCLLTVLNHPKLLKLYEEII